ncbi:MAG: UDP-N-acetylmuramoyl-L-alanine--D-glutamate ligase [Planctomycetaceae bacterium]
MMSSPTHSGFRNLPVTVMGLGRFGGGLGAVKFLLDRGARVTVTDLRPESQLADTLKEFDAGQLVRLQCGGHVDADFAEAELVVVNPAVKPGCPWLAKLRERGIPLTSEMSLFWQHNRGHVVGVTGSNGKSTTTALIAHLLKTAGRTVHLGGNLGVSLLPIVDQIKPTDWVVLELSSFQLADLDRIQASPEIAVVTNFAPNHLDWHPDLDDYRRAKQTILRWQTVNSTAVLNADDEDVRQWPTAGRRVFFGQSQFVPPNGCPRAVLDGKWLHLRSDLSSADHREGEAPAEPLLQEDVQLDSGSAGTSPSRTAPHPTLEIPVGDLFPLPGEHNRMNAAAAICATLAAGGDAATIPAGLQTFRGLPHRLELVGEVAGRRFYNDSLATTPESAICALRAFSGRLLLLAGGYDKKVDLAAFAHEAAQRCAAIAWMGQTAPLLESLAAQATGTAPPAGSQARRITKSLQEAFDWIGSQSHPGDTILLSPACASFDWFLNFADRGDQFRRLVAQLEKRDS